MAAKKKTNTPKTLARGEAASDHGAPRRATKRQQTAEALLDVSTTLGKLTSLDEQLERLVEMTTEATGADRGTLFLNDSLSNELYSRVAIGGFKREIRILNNSGVAGHVFQTGEPILTNDPYRHKEFNHSIDDYTGYVTKNLLCAPIRTMKGEIIGVAQVLNKKTDFTQEDLAILGAMINQASVVLQSSLYVEKMERAREQEAEFLRVVSEVSSEIKLGPLLQKIMGAVTRMLNSERSTLFLNDEKTNELFTEIGEGLGVSKIRFPNHIGIAGTVFTTNRSVNIPYAYADLRFNPSFDKQTDFFTRSILCVPLVNKEGKAIGVTQILNKRGGPFTVEDEARLRAFTAQISIALENATLFDDVQSTKNYIEGMLESMSNGVITINETGRIVTANAAGQKIFMCRDIDILGVEAKDFFAEKNAWLVGKIEAVVESQKPDITMDAELRVKGETRSINLTTQPLKGAKGEKLGTMLLMEDISTEKRVKSTMSRYMDASLADKLLEGGGDLLGGVSSEATVLFSDVRSFTTITEELGAQGTVALLNEYFSIMVECIQNEGGMLDKFIGDAIMAIFGTPMKHDDDPDRGVRAAISMLTDLAAWNKERVAHGKRPIDMGIGLNTGMIVSGNIGSPKRMDYTVIGDGVNLAARLESACKQYSARILISEATKNLLRGTYRMREIDLVIVKGKTKPVGVYEILDYYNDETFPNLPDVLQYFKSGLDQYRATKFDGAIKSFQEGLKLNPNDKLAKTYIERCRELKANHPGKNWDGVWTLTSK